MKRLIVEKKMNVIIYSLITRTKMRLKGTLRELRGLLYYSSLSFPIVSFLVFKFDVKSSPCHLN